MSRFNSAEFDQDLFGDGGTPEPSITEGRVAWEFSDGTNTYYLPVNPDAASTPTTNKNLSYQSTCAGQQITYEGRKSPGEMNFSGVILTEGQYRAFQTWFRINKQIRIKDDLGQYYWIYIKEFSPTRVKSNDYPWMHQYNASGIVLDRGSTTLEYNWNEI